MVVDVQQPLAASLSLPSVLSNTAHLPVQWQHTKPSQIKSWLDLKKVHASMIEGQCAGYTPNTILS